MSIDLTDAVEAGVAALRRNGLADDDDTGFVLENVYADGALQVALTAALPHIEAQIRAQIAAEIENRASQPRMEDSAPQWSVAKLQRDAYINGLYRAAQIARKENANA